MIMYLRQGAAGFQAKRSYFLLGVTLAHEFLWSVIGGWRSFLPISALLLGYIAIRQGSRVRLWRVAVSFALLYVLFVPLRPILLGYRVGVGVLGIREFGDIPDLIARSVAEAETITRDESGFVAALENFLILDAHQNLRSFLEIVPNQVDWYFGRTIFLQLLRYPLQWLGMTDNALYLDTGVQNWLFRDLGVIPPNETASFLTTPFHGELYINFGILAFPGLMLLGFVGSWTWSKTSSPNCDRTVFLELMFLYYFVYQGSYYSIGTLAVLLITKALFVLPLLSLVGGRPTVSKV
ncbi:MAG: hypothetical protein NTX13_03305 [Acidobacteria bacterium]|nr:hypothetical protein [Acidobacteriota bacterium]